MFWLKNEDQTRIYGGNSIGFTNLTVPFNPVMSLAIKFAAPLEVEVNCVFLMEYKIVATFRGKNRL